jgi:hypothetical protein
LTPTLEINAGVRQGGPLSTLLFNTWISNTKPGDGEIQPLN